MFGVDWIKHLPLTSGERLVTKLNASRCQVQRCELIKKNLTKSEPIAKVRVWGRLD